MENRVYLSWELIGSFMAEAFIKLGVPRPEAEICADVLMESDRRGIESHGCNRFKPIYIDRLNAGIQNPVTEFEILKETPTTAVVDGHDGMGMVVGYKAMGMAIDKAKKYGMGMVAARNSTHYGIAGYYTSMAVRENMIGITGTNARPSIAPTFGVENMLGTNPLTFGLPTDEDFPFTLDCATSITQRGKIEYFAREGKPTPAGMVVGPDGKAMTDSNKILDDLVTGQAALAPLGGIGEELGGYKGYGYATVVEILSAALQAGSYMKMLTGIGGHGEKVPYHLGHFFIAIDTEAFMGAEAFKKPPAIFFGNCGRPPSRRAKTVYTPPAKRSTSPGLNGRTKACRWVPRCKRNSSPSVTVLACSTGSHLKLNSQNTRSRSGIYFFNISATNPLYRPALTYV